MWAGVSSRRDALGLLAQYEGGKSTRVLAEETSCSYGDVHRLLENAGAAFRVCGMRRRAVAGLAP